MEDLKLNVESVLGMNGGQGQASYAQNSRYQETGLRFVQHFLEEFIREMKLIPCERFCIADMGCAAGPNTLFVAETISLAVRNNYSSSSMPMPDLHLFFSDLPSNDFNLLLQNIHHKHNNATSRPCKYYAAAVAGSFHLRLFPRRSLHFVHSSYGLHWLSRVPPEIEDRNSRCWNGEGVFISKGKEGTVEVAEAYLRQFQQDLKGFLRARGEKVVEGGRMFLLMLGREGCDPGDQESVVADALKSALDDVLARGEHLTDRRTVENFNLPFFFPCVEEVRCEVDKEGSFRVVRMQFVRQAKSDVVKMENGFGRKVANGVRAVLERLMACHFGEEVVDAVFERVAVRAEEKASSLFTQESEAEGIVALLERTSIAKT